MRVLLSRLYPLEMGWDGAGVDFALLSEIATAAGRCFFNQSDQTKESPRIRSTERINLTRHTSSQRSSLHIDRYRHSPHDPTWEHKAICQTCYPRLDTGPEIL